MILPLKRSRIAHVSILRTTSSKFARACSIEFRDTGTKAMVRSSELKRYGVGSAAHHSLVCRRISLRAGIGDAAPDLPA